jgi:hypothetical protein
MAEVKRPNALSRKHTQELTDASAHHLPTPGPDTGSFSTLEVRSRTTPAEITSRTIAFPRNNYSRPPNVAGGFKMLDLGVTDTPAVRANLVGSDISKDEFRIGLETWEGGVMWAAAATWIEHKAGAKDCHFGQFDTMDMDDEEASEAGVSGTTVSDANHSDGEGGYDSEENSRPRQDYTRKSRFPVKFDEPPVVVCWLNRLDFPVGPSHKHFRVRASASRITRRSATFNLSTWGDPYDSVLNGAALCWIAFPQGKRKVDSGTFGVGDYEMHENQNQQTKSGKKQRSKVKNTGRIEFRSGQFTKPPTVLVALNMLDMGAESDLRIRAEAEDVDSEGFTWRLETWVSAFLVLGTPIWICRDGSSFPPRAF